MPVGPASPSHQARMVCVVLLQSLFALISRDGCLPVWQQLLAASLPIRVHACGCTRARKWAELWAWLAVSGRSRRGARPESHDRAERSPCSRVWTILARSRIICMELDCRRVYSCVRAEHAGSSRSSWIAWMLGRSHSAGARTEFLEHGHPQSRLLRKTQFPSAS